MTQTTHAAAFAEALASPLAACQDCELPTRGLCTSCLRPTCDTCTRGRECSDPVCWACHSYRCTSYYCGAGLDWRAEAGIEPMSHYEEYHADEEMSA